MTSSTPERPPETQPMAEVRPPRVTPRIISAPAIRQMFWCDFWNDAQLPEMWKTRPVVVASYKNTLSGPCTVLPTSSEPQDRNPWAHKLSFMPDGRSPSWVICNHPLTVAPSRFSQFKGTIPRVAVGEFDAILGLLLKWLPRPSVPPTK